MVTIVNIKRGSTGGGGGSVSGSVVTEILNDVTGTDIEIATTISGGTYNVYVSTDNGVTFTLFAEDTDYTRSGQTISFNVPLSSDIVKFEFTYS